MVDPRIQPYGYALFGVFYSGQSLPGALRVNANSLPKKLLAIAYCTLRACQSSRSMIAPCSGLLLSGLKMTIDTAIMEYTAEDLIAHKLQRAGILVAKPKFDQDGADLLALLDVKDNAKFCRIQCKGRSLASSKRTNVKIPNIYASDGFVLFLFIETGHKDQTYLYCFFGKDIRNLWKRQGDCFVLNISARSFESELSAFLFDNHKVDEIIKTIINMNVTGEFNLMWHGYAEISVPPITITAG